MAEAGTFGSEYKRAISMKMSVGGGEPAFNIENLIASALYAVGGFFGGRLIAKKTGKGRFLTVNKKAASKEDTATQEDSSSEE